MKKIYKIKVNGKAYEVELQQITSVEGNVETPTAAVTPAAPVAAAPTGGEQVSAPMPGAVVDIRVSMGQQVTKGQVVAILEAMKMETELLAPCDGTVTGIHCEKGAQVNLGDAIVSLG